MKTYKRIKNTTAERTLRAVLATHDRLRGCYHWRPPSNASGRRRMESDHSRSLEFSYMGTEYAITQTTDVSCQNVYYRLSVEVDGKRRDIRAVKRLLA